MFPINTHILLIDDMKGLRSLLAKMINQMGFPRVSEVSNGLEALEFLESSIINNQPVDLLICDMKMPGMDGMEFLKRIKTDARFNKLPFLMLSAESEKEAIVAAIRGGIDDYIVKPATVFALTQKFEKMWARVNPNQAT